MRRFWLLAAVLGVASALSLVQARASEPAKGGKPVQPAVKPADTDEAGGKHGTAVNFVDTPSEAARQALKEQKLVLVLHISGIFEDPGCT